MSLNLYDEIYNGFSLIDLYGYCNGTKPSNRKTSSGTGWGLNVINSDLNGNEVITKMEEPDGPEIMGQKMARISYEIKTISPYNEPAYLWASFQKE
ncbi:hypothetical protein [Pedobacter sp. KLB.chiD]|uniref:hypothetical protein n=1 Tax=Pedobacter sp. KLB.chiD TaxID=3387402 RepID=UPI00399B0F9D